MHLTSRKLSFLVTIGDYEMMCRWHAVWTFFQVPTPGLLFQSVMDTDNTFSIDSDSLAMKARLGIKRVSCLRQTNLKIVVVSYPEPLTSLADVSLLRKLEKAFTYLESKECCNEGGSLVS